MLFRSQMRFRLQYFVDGLPKSDFCSSEVEHQANSLTVTGSTPVRPQTNPLQAFGWQMSACGQLVLEYRSSHSNGSYEDRLMTTTTYLTTL